MLVELADCAFAIIEQEVDRFIPHHPGLMHPQEKLLNDLRAWARAEHGRDALLARELGVSPGLLSHWLTGRRTPTLRDGLAIQEFLKAQAMRPRKKNP